MTARERLQNARENASAGRYPEALLDLIWFHEHALEENPALYGVRLSYALDDWVQLGKKYPPALASLESLRDQKADALRHGDLGKSAFVDIAAINEYLDSTSSTYSLYLELMVKQPELGTECARVALPSIVEAEDYRLADHLTPDPEPTIRRESADLNRRVRMLKHEAYSRAPTRWAYVRIHVDGIQRMLRIKVGIGEHTEAARLKALAISLIESPSLRREVQSGFLKRARAPSSR